MKFSYRNSKMSVLASVCHIIGQMQQMGMTVKVSDIAVFMQVTKQTAKRYLQELEKSGAIEHEEKPYRGNIHVNHYRLTENTYANYRVGWYKPAYRVLLDSREIPF